jgi:hypothetical protein
MMHLGVGGVRDLNCMTMTQEQHALLQTRAENDDVVFAGGEGGQTGGREGSERDGQTIERSGCWSAKKKRENRKKKTGKRKK